jgi:hypothetical protein
MKPWLKENWFKVLILILLGIFLWLYRFDYIPREEAPGWYVQCNRFTGSCISCRLPSFP